MERLGRRLLLWSGVLIAMASGPGVRAQEDFRFDEAALERLGSVPIQSEGRVKPLLTFARFKMIRLSGGTSVEDMRGGRVGPMRWLARTLLRPESARVLRVVRVEDPRLMQALGLPDTDRRTRFSYEQLVRVRPKLIAMARRYIGIPSEARTDYQRRTLRLYDHFADLEALMQALDVARIRVAADHAPEGTENRGRLSFSDLLPHLSSVVERWQREEDAGSGELMRLLEAALGSDRLALIPPRDPERRQWYAPAGLLEAAVSGQVDLAAERELLAGLEAMARAAAVGHREAFARAVDSYRTRARAMARGRGEGRYLDLETRLYRWRLVRRALALFGISFVLVALVWLAPRNRWLAGAAWTTLVAGTVLLAAAIVIRCVIRGRPPVTNLYETTLFVPLVAIVMALGMEAFRPRRIGLSLAAVLGVGGLLLAGRYELTEGGDTMGRMVAVLDSNFWLTSHVMTIAVGYSAGLLASALAHVYILGRVGGLWRRGEQVYAEVARMVYGVTCFCLVFSLVGTVLGGVWAMRSWGRFWGWDPKENGALLIILWLLVVLHAWRGGYLGRLGLCVGALLGGVVVSVSWWGVNLLGVGLHSYGFTSGILGGLLGFWLVEAGMLLLAAMAWRVERRSGGSSFEAGEDAVGVEHFPNPPQDTSGDDDK